MLTAKLFDNGRSQAVRLPKEYRFTGTEVSVNKIGDVVLLMPKDHKWSALMTGLDMFSDDFMSNGREEQIIQERKEL